MLILSIIVAVTGGITCFFLDKTPGKNTVESSKNVVEENKNEQDVDINVVLKQLSQYLTDSDAKR